MKTNILACILAVVTVLSVFPMTVAAATVSVTSDGFQYTTDENGATIVGYSGSDTELYIPYSIKGKKVIAIAECALEYLEDVTYIEVPPYRQADRHRGIRLLLQYKDSLLRGHRG